MENVYRNAGERLGRFISDVKISYDTFANVTGIEQERLQEIIEARGEELTLFEVTQICERAMISADYLFGMQDHPYPFDPTEDNLRKFHEKIQAALDNKI